jgi:hypothetical protein
VVAGLIGFAAASSAQTEPQMGNEIPYVSGGIGSPSQREMRAVRKNYNLHLLFAVKGTGEYLADIPVTIADAKGRVLLEATAEGPFFFARLPAGRYRVTAGTGAEAITRTVSIGSRGSADASFYWNEAP